MASKSTTPWYGCPVRFALGIFGDKWTLLIVRDLVFKNRRHFNEFLDPEEPIATNILADRLRKLEANQIVRKQVDIKNRSRFVYSLTNKGKDMIPILFEIINWSEKYDPQSDVPKDFVAAVRKYPDKFEANIRKKLDQ